MFFFVKKFENRFRFYINYRDLNTIIVKNKYFLFLIFEILNCFSRVKIFIKLNIILVFNRLYIRKKKKTLIVFYICFKFFKFFIIYFDLYNRFVLFQKYINKTLREFLNKFCIIYLDNILIYNNNKLKYKIYIKFIF